MKRGYYSTKVDKEFEKAFEFEIEEEKAAYFQYVALYTYFANGVKLASRERSLKQIFYFLFLLALPLRIPYTPVFYLVACVLSVFEKK